MLDEGLHHQTFLLTMLKVSILTTKLTIQPLLNNSTVASLHELQQRIAAFKCLPGNCLLLAQSPRECCLQVQLCTAATRVPLTASLVVNERFEWQLSIRDHVVDPTNGVLTGVESYLNSPC